MDNAQLETNRNLWFRLVAKAEDDEFKEKLLTETGDVLNIEKKEIRREVIKELLNDPDKMEQVFGSIDDAEGMEIEEMEERLAAFGYIGW